MLALSFSESVGAIFPRRIRKSGSDFEFIEKVHVSDARFFSLIICGDTYHTTWSPEICDPTRSKIRVHVILNNILAYNPVSNERFGSREPHGMNGRFIATVLEDLMVHEPRRPATLRSRARANSKTFIFPRIRGQLRLG